MSKVKGRVLLLDAFSNGSLNYEEFLLLYDINTSKNLDIPYWQYPSFDLDLLQNDECRSEFRLNTPNEIICYNGFKVNGIDALCMLLKRFAYPCHYLDMIPQGT